MSDPRKRLIPEAKNGPPIGKRPTPTPAPPRAKVCGVEVVPDSAMRILCGECDYHLKGGAMNYCPQCGAALLAEFRWVPPPSQEARAAASGRTRTK